MFCQPSGQALTFEDENLTMVGKYELIANLLLY